MSMPRQQQPLFQHQQIRHTGLLHADREDLLDRSQFPQDRPLLLRQCLLVRKVVEILEM